VDGPVHDTTEVYGALPRRRQGHADHVRAVLRGAEK
jgi:hypothetical protein